MMKSILSSRPLVAILVMSSVFSLTIGMGETVGKPLTIKWNQQIDNLDLVGYGRPKMCSTWLGELDTEENPLDLDKVVQLFDSSLEQLAHLSGKRESLRPYTNDKKFRDDDESWIQLGIKISKTRSQLIEEYKFATEHGRSQEKKKSLLMSYFDKACRLILQRMLADQALREDTKKIEETYGVKI